MHNLNQDDTGSGKKEGDGHKFKQSRQKEKAVRDQLICPFIIRYHQNSLWRGIFACREIYITV